MVMRNIRIQLFMTTVFEDVAFGLLNLGVREAELEGKVMAALKSQYAGKLDMTKASAIVKQVLADNRC